MTADTLTHTNTDIDFDFLTGSARIPGVCVFVCWMGGGGEGLQSIRIKFSTDKQTCRPIRTSAASN